MRRYSVQVGEKSYEVGFVSRIGSAITFELDGRQHTVSVQPQQLTTVALTTPSVLPPTSAPVSKSITASPDKIVAPMPGIIVSIACKLGDPVRAGQTVVVMEAMKMENNLVAPRDGKIKSLDVAPGAEVNQGQVLVQLES